LLDTPQQRASAPFDDAIARRFHDALAPSKAFWLRSIGALFFGSPTSEQAPYIPAARLAATYQELARLLHCSGAACPEMLKMCLKLLRRRSGRGRSIKWACKIMLFKTWCSMPAA